MRTAPFHITYDDVAVLLTAGNLLYLATPHTASRSTARALEAIGGRSSPRHHDTLDDLLQSGFITQSELESVCVVTTVRNHFDVLVTWWLARGRGRPFPQFLKLLVTLPDEVSPDGRLFWKHFDDADVALRYESLADHLAALLAPMRLAVSLPHVGVSKPRDSWPTHYDVQTRRFVESAFARELAALSYAWESPPGQPPLRRTPAWRTTESR